MKHAPTRRTVRAAHVWLRCSVSRSPCLPMQFAGGLILSRKRPSTTGSFVKYDFLRALASLALTVLQPALTSRFKPTSRNSLGGGYTLLNFILTHGGRFWFATP